MAERQRQSLKSVASEARLPPEMDFSVPRVGAPNDISTLLAEERARQGVEQSEVAASLRIRLTYIEAIDDGRFEDLPGATYAAGFIRAYAGYLGLDQEAVVQLFKAQAGDADGRPELHYPTPLPEGRFLGRRVIMASLSLAALVYGGWYYLSVEKKTDLAQAVPEVPARIAQSVPGAMDGTSEALAESPQASNETPGVVPGIVPGVVSGSAPATGESAGATDVLTPMDVTVAMSALDGPADQPVPVMESGTGAASAEVTAPATSTIDVREPLAAETVASVSPGIAPTSPMRDVLASQGEGPVAEESAAENGDAIPSAPAAPSTVSPPPLQSSTSVASISPVAGDVTPLVPVVRVSPNQAAAATPPPAPVATVPSTRVEAVSLSPEMPRVYGMENADARVVLRAIEDSWVQVRNRSSAVILTRILRRGDSYKVPDEPGLTLLTGNAGGLSLAVDGVEIPPLGTSGEVLRGVSLDPERLLARPPAAED